MRPIRHMLLSPIAAMAIVAMAGPGAARASDPPSRSMPKVDLRTQAPIQGDARAGSDKTEVCAACHGKRGMATAGNFPNLAGQTATYLYVQLRAYKDGWRKNETMQPMAMPLSDKDMRDIAAWYATLEPSATPDEMARGSRGGMLFHQGDPDRGIPGCQGCHGVDGHGPRPDPTSTAPQPAWSTFPALAGQSSAYVLEQLQAYKEQTRKGSTNARVMHGVAANLDADDMKALAGYIATMPP